MIGVKNSPISVGGTVGSFSTRFLEFSLIIPTACSTLSSFVPIKNVVYFTPNKIIIKVFHHEELVKTFFHNHLKHKYPSSLINNQKQSKDWAYFDNFLPSYF